MEEQQPKLEWTSKAWTKRKSEEHCHDESGEDHEHWYAHLGEFVDEGDERHVARLRYCPKFEDLWLIGDENEDEMPLVELNMESDGDLASKLAACEQLCLRYMQEAFGKLLKTVS